MVVVMKGAKFQVELAMLCAWCVVVVTPGVFRCVGDDRAGGVSDGGLFLLAGLWVRPADERTPLSLEAWASLILGCKTLLQIRVRGTRSSASSK